MTTPQWELLQRQGSREVWVKYSYDPDGTKKTRYKGEERSVVGDESHKVDDVEHFDTETQALAWLNGGVG
jgi:hypothetical protein